MNARNDTLQVGETFGNVGEVILERRMIHNVLHRVEPMSDRMSEPKTVSRCY